jgi:DMSO/TMAO reductase YedYZ molybdopterin-dependent catalytic subunit
MNRPTLNRRRLAALIATTGAAAVAGCDQITDDDKVSRGVQTAEVLTRSIQRLILSPGQFAPEDKESEISKWFKPNGSTDPQDDAYVAHRDKDFRDWKLEVTGLVEHTLSLSLDQLRALPSRTQITRHDCVEGWSCIGKWKGARLSEILKAAKLRREARYVVFHCADSLGDADDGSDDYYESIALADAFHPQTILAYDMNDQPLGVPHGAPIRLRVERQLGYKQAKYVMKVEAVASLDHLHGGHGGYWEDRGYEWYGGI